MYLSNILINRTQDLYITCKIKESFVCVVKTIHLFKLNQKYKNKKIKII
jgi:hypothetical protein